MKEQKSNASEMMTNREDDSVNSSSDVSTSQIPKPSIVSREVSFSSIEIREYPRCMGDNPGCLRGVPITIEWSHTSERSLSLEEYEEARGEPNELIAIPPNKRFEMLQKSYTRAEIMKQLQKVEHDRERRRLSCTDSEKFEESKERLKRGFLNKTFRRKTKQKEKELLLPYLPKESQSVSKGRLGRSYSISSTTSCESNSFEDDNLSNIASEVDEQLKIEA